MSLVVLPEMKKESTMGCEGKQRQESKYKQIRMQTKTISVVLRVSCMVVWSRAVGGFEDVVLLSFIGLDEELGMG